VSFIFSPPANLNDYNDALRDKWNAFMSDQFDSSVRRLAKKLKATPQFYSPARRSTRPTALFAAIPWNGYPQRVSLIHRGSYSEADSLATFNQPDPAGFPYGLYYDSKQKKPVADAYYRPQDEYLEWYVSRDAQGRITKVTFTAEPPEYWQYFFKYDETGALALIRDLLGRNDIKADDLRAKETLYNDYGAVVAERGYYNMYNKLVTESGIVHLSHPSNSLAAEIQLAADASVKYEAQGVIITDSTRLACCADFGEPSRFSDPKIGSDVNARARAGAWVTLADPVGLYIDSMDTSQITEQDNSPTDAAWFSTIRPQPVDPNAPTRIVRAEYSKPGGFVSDLRVGGIPIDSGGQLARLITMHLFAYADGSDAPQCPSKPCAAHCCVSDQNVLISVGAKTRCSGRFGRDPYPNDHPISLLALKDLEKDASIEPAPFHR
jgi:hypothetical protein